MSDLWDINAPYNVEEYGKDMAGMSAALKSNITDFPKEFNVVDDKRGTTDAIRFNTTHPMYKTMKYFTDTYGWEKGASRMMRIMAMARFIDENKSTIIKLGLGQQTDDGVSLRTEFLEYLLSYKIASKKQVIPKKAFREFNKL